MKKPGSGSRGNLCNQALPGSSSAASAQHQKGT